MIKGLFYILVAAVAFTTLEPASKLIATQINPVSITFLRFFIGSLALLPFSYKAVRKKGLRLGFSDYLKMTGLGVLCICVSMVLLQYAVLKAHSPALIAIIFSSNSMFTIILAIFILKDKLTVKKIIALIFCLFGVLLCADFKSSTGIFSVFLAVLASLTFSLYTVLSKKLAQKVLGIVQTGISFFAGSLVLLVILLVSGIRIVQDISFDNVAMVLYLGVIVTGVGYWGYFKAMEKSSALSASMVFFIKPILTPFATFFINKITPQSKIFAALTLVLIGSYLAVLPPQVKKASGKPEGRLNINADL